MTELSDARIAALARLALRVIATEGRLLNERGALAESKRVLRACFQQRDAVDAAVRQKIASLSRGVAEGSPEWEVRYRQYFAEESRKRKF